MTIAPSANLTVCVVNTFDNEWLVSLPHAVEMFPDRDQMLAAVRARVRQASAAGGRCTVSHSDRNDQWSDITALVAQ